MVWFKVDDNLAFHHKVIAAGNPAMGLWVRAGSMCAQQLTDGFVPNHMVAALGTVAQANRLVQVGLWDRAEGGYTFHEWTERQPSKDDVEAERAAAKERMRAARARKKTGSSEATPQVSAPRSPEHAPNEQRTSPEVRDVFGNPDPTRPDPTLVPDGTSGTRKRAKSRLPQGWKPTAEHLERAMAAGVTLGTEVEKFKAHAATHDRTAVNWNAAFTQWLIKAAEYAQRDRPRGDDTPVYWKQAR